MLFSTNGAPVQHIIMYMRTLYKENICCGAIYKQSRCCCKMLCISVHQNVQVVEVAVEWNIKVHVSFQSEGGYLTLELQAINHERERFSNTLSLLTDAFLVPMTILIHSSKHRCTFWSTAHQLGKRQICTSKLC